MRDIWIIGIGAGSPAYVTGQAAAALAQVDVFVVADKGAAKDELVALRRGICQEYAKPGYQLIAVADPARGDDASRDRDAYTQGVLDWHTARAGRYTKVIDGLPPETVVGFLVWGDPAFYDSTIRIVEAMSAQTPCRVRVIPGISAIQVLAAEHRIVLHDIGQPVHITTGRRLVEEWSPALGTVVVMLDGHLACAGLLDRAPTATLYWGAYLGLPQQVLRSGPLAETIEEVRAVRAALRAEHGWLMDIYALVP